MSLKQLFPQGGERPLQSAYLGLGLQRRAAQGGITLYANFVASVDGRISRFNPQTGDFEVPAELANARDWRLYQELAAQSDILITSARYFRQLSSGTAQDLLPVGDDFADLQQWRLDQGLKAQPDVAILSNSLDIPISAIEKLGERSTVVFSCERASADRKEKLEEQGYTVVITGEERVEGVRLQQALIDMGYRSGYMIAGPEVHTALIDAGVLDLLFLTTRFTLLGGKRTHGFFDGKGGDNMQLLSLYLDEEGGQLFAQYAMQREHDGESNG